MNMITEQAQIANRRTSNFRAILVVDRRFMSTGRHGVDD